MLHEWQAHKYKKEGRGAIARAPSFANVAACRAVLNPA